MLTDNEKAATFTGWKAHCSEHYGFERCSKAPHMIEPDNYMKAWHMFAEENNDKQIIVETNLGHAPYRRFKVYIEDNTGSLLTNCYPVANIGEGIIKALAFFYDTEHEGKE